MKTGYTTQQQRDFGSTLLDQVGGALTGGISGAVGGLINTGLGLITGQWSEANQLKQNQALLNQQVAANETMSQFNYGQQLDMWNATNYEAQMQHIQNAGLNPALLYAKGGPGGTTTGSPSGGVATPAPSGVQQSIATMQQAQQLAIQQRQAEAQIDLTKAQAQNVQADTANKEATTPNIGLEGQNIQADTALKEVNAKIAKLQETYQGATLEQSIANFSSQATSIMAQAKTDVANSNIVAATQETVIKQTQQNLVETGLKIALDKSQLQVNNAEIKQWATQLVQAQQQININQQNATTNTGNLELQKTVQNVSNSTKLSVDTITKIINAVIHNL